MNPLLPRFDDNDEPIYQNDEWEPLPFTRPLFDDNDEMYFKEDEED